ncbi:hypothetical protein O181_083432 [Austropuccinia psidii MF-1]|uniref:Uncharacterized protein n=1 Tax=Austropuccinia psidii MF-1 TaxID=1389203 RepID=A0A9Q3IK34_9BASI|nr:hypothetical protein [Austropuccinia psidii MF-1]
MSIINVTEEARKLHSHPDTSALNSLKEISLKNQITINKDLKPQENPIFQGESIDSTSKPKESADLNRILENVIVNQTTNGNDYGQETARKESRIRNVKNSMDESKPVLPKEVIRSPI